jgi:hypothetical protein
MEIIRNFIIDARNPINNSVFDAEDTKLSEAIYTIFPMEADDIRLFWGDACIPLSYRYDISTIIDDLIEMVQSIHEQIDGKWSVDWSSNTFATNWTFKWSGDYLEIQAIWRDEFQADQYLKEHSLLCLDKTIYLREWNKIIDVLLKNLEICGYTMHHILGLNKLISVNEMVKRRSIIY